MTEVLLRRAEEADLDAVFAIETACFSVPWSRESFAAAFSSDLTGLFVASEGETLLGFGCVSVLAPDGEIMNIAVLPDCRGRGIGGRLLQAMLDFSAERGADTVYLEVRESNAPARALYEKAGFRPLGLRKNYYTKPREHALLMGLTLPASAEE